MMKDLESVAINALKLTEYFELFEQLGPFENNPSIAVAVSGGADSLALTLLLYHWIKTKNGKLYALTVDHQLRKESYEEFNMVSRWLNFYNISHLRLEANIPKIKNLSEQARLYRYELLTNWCKNKQLLHLFLGHTQDDQAENFIIRASRGSGLEGLSHIKHILYQNNVRILRPFLNITKEKLQTFLKSQNQPWIEDPTNCNTKYLRVKIRNFLNFDINEPFLVKKRLREVSKNLYEANKIFNNLVYDFIMQYVIISDKGFMEFNYQQFLKLDKFIALKVLAKSLILIGGLANTPRLKNLNNLYSLVTEIEKIGPNTYCHCLLIKHSQNNSFFLIPHRTLFPFLIQNNQFIWLNRFHIKIKNTILNKYKSGLIIDKFNKSDYQYLKENFLVKTLDNTPKEVLFSLPVIKLNNYIAAVPHIEYFTESLKRNHITIKLYNNLKI